MKRTAQWYKGFTLIELLIVIALLGALAVGLLATIDPFEQLKKGRDTATRNTVSEFYNANLRYYSTKAAFPWTAALSSAAVYPGLTAYINDLVAVGELKERFVDLAGTGNLTKIKVTSNGTDTIAVCFEPESKGFQADPSTIYDALGVADTVPNCKSKVGATGVNCNFCVQ